MKTKVTGLALAVVFVGASATAQAINFSQIDLNGDRILQQDELITAFGETGAAALSALDKDGDGDVSLKEAADTDDDQMSDGRNASSEAQGLNRSARGSVASEAKGANRSERGNSKSENKGGSRS